MVVYLSDVEEGGETVFPEGERLGAPVSDAEARADVRPTHTTNMKRPIQIFGTTYNKERRGYVCGPIQVQRHVYTIAEGIYTVLKPRADAYYCSWRASSRRRA